MIPQFSEMSVVFRFGGALITSDGVGRTAVCSIDISESHFNFNILKWYDTYDEALGVLAIIFDDEDESDEPGPVAAIEP